MPLYPNKKTQAVSLLELLITVVILVLLFVLLQGRSAQSFQTRAKNLCRERLQTLHLGLQLYANEHEGRFPVVTHALSSEEPLSLLLPAYISTTEPFVCPGTKRRLIPEGGSLTRYGISYAYYMGRSSAEGDSLLLTDAQVDTSEKAVGSQMFSEDGKGPGNNHHEFGGNGLAVDGSAVELRRKAVSAVLHHPGLKLLNPK